MCSSILIEYLPVVISLASSSQQQVCDKTGNKAKEKKKKIRCWHVKKFIPEETTAAAMAVAATLTYKTTTHRVFQGKACSWRFAFSLVALCLPQEASTCSNAFACFV